MSALRLASAVLTMQLLMAFHSLQPPQRSVQEVQDEPLATRGVVPSADGVPIAYTSRGESGSAIVLIHCGFCDSTFWDSTVRSLLKKYRVVTLDLAGHGRSGQQRLSWTVTAFGEDVRAVAEALDLRDVVLIGHSVGGPVALEAARLMPQRVRGIIAVDTLHDAEAPWNEEAWRERTEAFAADFAATCRSEAGRMFPEGTDRQLIHSVSDRMCDMPPALGVALLGAFNRYDMAAAFGEAGVPIRAINGDLYPTNVEGNRRLSPGYRAVILTETGHFPMLERPQEFNQQLARLIEELLGG